MLKLKSSRLAKFAVAVPVFCSIAVLSTQLEADPFVQFFGDKSNMVQSGKLGYVGGNTRLGVSVDKDLQGQADLSQVINESDSSLTSADLWLGYKLKDNDSGTKGAKGGGVKLNHHWVGEEKDRVHKVFGAYDRDKEGHAKATLGYGQEKQDLFWSGHISKGLGDEDVVGDVTTRAYDYGVGVEAGTFLDESLTRIRGGIDYEVGTDYDDSESRPDNLTISAGVEQFFQDSPHSISLDVSGSKSGGGNRDDDTDYNARLGYHYEFGGDGAFQSAMRKKNIRVEIPGTSGRPAIPAIAGTPARPAVPAKYERRLIKRPGFKLVKTTMKLENETFFEKNSSKLTYSAIQNLNKITQQIRSNGYIGAIRITGNTCGLGSAAYDQKLSEMRAKEVQDYLVTKGIDSRNLIARGLGKNHPKYVKKDTGFKNRRVDIEFVTERLAKKQDVRYKNVLIQQGRPAIPAIPGRPAVPAVSGSPARYVWKTEVVKSAPIWIKRALHNEIRHNNAVSTYSTRSQQQIADDHFTVSSHSMVLDVLGNDSANLTLVSATQPSNGQVIIEGSSIRYIPNPGFSGTDTFTYTVRDASGKLVTATVTIEVPNVVNHVPVATNNTASTNLNNEVIIDVLSDDTDADGGELSINSTTNPSHGTVSIVNDQLQYVPNAGYAGTDSFTYTIIDNNGNISNPATVTVTVAGTGTNGAPAAQDDTASTSENTPVTITSVTNDNDPDGDTLSIVANSLTNPINGTVSLNGNDIVYTPNTGFSGTDSFDYTITDPDGLTSTATVNVTISNVNVAPTAVDDAISTPENTPVTITAVSNDTDPDGDTLSIVANSLTNPINGTVSLNGNDIVYTPNTGFSGTDSFNYTITDPDGLTSSATVNVTISNVNVAPVAVDDAISTPENTPVTITAVSNDTDPDGDTLSIVANSLTNPINGTVSLNGNDIVYTPNTGFSGTDSFNYTITDPDGLTSSATVNVTISNVNVAPVAVDDAISTPENTPVTITPVPNDLDADGDTLSIVANSLTTPANGTVSLSGNDVVYTPNNGFSGTDSFDYTITDPDGLTNTATVNVTISNVNVAPVAVDDAISTPENMAITITPVTNDTDPDGDTLSIVANSLTTPANGTVSLSGNDVVYTPNNGFSGTDSFDYTVTDPDGLTSIATVTVTVNNVNVAPVAVDDTATTDENTPVTITPVTNDTDADGDALSIVANSLTNPANGTVSLNGNDIVYTPNNGFDGTDSFDYRITDPDGLTSIATVTVTVNNVNVAPVAVDDTATTDENTPVTIPVITNDTDADGDTLSVVSKMTDPSNGSIVLNGDGTFTYTPNTNYSGTDSFDYKMTDGNGLEDIAMVTITVNDTNIPPVAIDDSYDVMYQTATLLDVLGNDSDPDGGTLCITQTSSPTNGSTDISATGDSITYTPDNGYTGPDSFTYTACDSGGGSAVATVSINVINPQP